MNARNYYIIGKHNKRSLYPLVDDKVKTKTLANSIDINTPKMIGVIEHQYEVLDLIIFVGCNDLTNPPVGGPYQATLIDEEFEGRLISDHRMQ